METISDYLRFVSAKVKKGDIRNTVLRQIRALERSLSFLTQGRDIKEQEVQEFRDKDPKKAKRLREQISIISKGILHINHAIKELEEYRDTSSH